MTKITKLSNLVEMLSDKVEKNNSVEGSTVSQREEPPRAALNDVTDRLDKIEKKSKLQYTNLPWTCCGIAHC